MKILKKKKSNSLISCDNDEWIFPSTILYTNKGTSPWKSFVMDLKIFAFLFIPYWFSGLVSSQVYVGSSGKTGNDLGHAFGYLKASSNLSCVNLVIMPYNYPVLLPLLDDLFKVHKLKPSIKWRQAFDNYLRDVPNYYAGVSLHLFHDSFICSPCTLTLLVWSGTKERSLLNAIRVEWGCEAINLEDFRGGGMGVGYLSLMGCIVITFHTKQLHCLDITLPHLSWF